MKKILSVFLSLILAAAAFAVVPFTASAAETYSFSISMSGTEYNKIAKTETDRINTARKNSGMDEIGVDAYLQAFAQKRAAESVLGGSFDHSNGKYTETCSDSVSVTAYYPDYGKNVFSVSANNYKDFKKNIDVLCSPNYRDIKSIGISIFRFKNTYSYYAIFSKNKSAKPFSDFNDKDISKTIRVNYQYIKYFQIQTKPKADKYYKLSVQGMFGGYYSNYLTIPNSQLSYVSSKPKVYKIKGYKGYVKGSGKYSIKLYDKYSTALCTFKNLKSHINKTAPNLYVKSKKKGQLYVRWQTIKDGSGYQIKYSLKKNMKGAKTKTVKGAKKKSLTIKKLKKGKKYYVRVRAYKNQGNKEKVYTKWSAKKSVKVK